MLIKYCVFFEVSKFIPDTGLSSFSVGVSVCTHTRQVEHQGCSRTGRVQKIQKNLRKKTLFDQHPVQPFYLKIFVAGSEFNISKVNLNVVPKYV